MLGTVERALLAAGDPGADEVQAHLSSAFSAAARVLVVGVAAVHHDVALLEEDGTSWSMTASVPPPALTMMIIFRGRSRLATNSSSDSDATNVPSDPCSATSSVVFAVVRQYSATVYP